MMRYDIDIGGRTLIGLEILNEELTVMGAIDGYGNGIRLEDIKITKKEEAENPVKSRQTVKSE